MPLSVLFKKQTTDYEVYPYTDEELDFVERVYDDLQKDIQLKNQTWSFLNGRTLRALWDDGQENFNVIFDKVRDDDEFKQYRRTLTRDNLNLALATITRRMIYPEIFAQNEQQIIDRLISRVLTTLYRWAEDNDGRPAESGQYKMLDWELTRFLEGTVHVQDDYTNGQFIRELVPNEEVFFPNFWQVNLQLQPHVFRYKKRILYQEAERIYGHLDNWKYVRPGATSQWSFSQYRKFQNWDAGLIDEDQVGILYAWYDVPISERGNKEKPEKYSNIFINGVPMYAPDHKSPYKHGYYPIFSCILERLVPGFYWGNSLPNKLGPDQKLADALYTIIVNKEKLSLLPPLLAGGGMHIEQDWIGFSKITTVQGDPSQVVKIPGVAEPPSVGSINLLEMVEQNQRGSSPVPINPSQPLPSRQPATTTLAQQGSIDLTYALYSLRLAQGVEAGALLRLHNLIQFLPRRKVNGLARVSIPRATMIDGEEADLEILFQSARLMSEAEEKGESHRLFMEEEGLKQRGRNVRRSFIDPDYLTHLDLHISVTGNPIDRKNDEFERLVARRNYLEIYRGDPLINQIAARRNLIRKIGDNEQELLLDQDNGVPSAQVPAPVGAGGGQGVLSEAGRIQQEATNLPTQIGMTRL